MLAAALAADAQPPTVISDRHAAQAWLQAARYHPSIPHLGVKQRVGARFVAANATTTDHPVGERVCGNYSVVTVESVFDFLHQRDALAQELSIPHATATAGATP
ncbi:putative membrane protein [Xanthomonas oryzae pv. oryzicola]|nr:putative membrane protein [Xanthomonas oryzae pv. oryzicola]